MTDEKLNELKAEEQTPDFQELFDEASDADKEATCRMLAELGLE